MYNIVQTDKETIFSGKKQHLQTFGKKPKDSIHISAVFGQHVLCIVFELKESTYFLFRFAS